MKQLTILVLAIAAMIVLGAHLGATAEGQTQTAIMSATSVQPAASEQAKAGELNSFRLSLNEVFVFDYAKCIESCDAQYDRCTKNADADKIKYCSNQHDQCRKACLEHK